MKQYLRVRAAVTYDIRSLWYGRHGVKILAGAILSAFIAVAGTWSSLFSGIRVLRQEIAAGSLGQGEMVPALEGGLRLARSGAIDSSTEPLQAEYARLIQMSHSLHGWSAVGTIMELGIFVVMPTVIALMVSQLYLQDFRTGLLAFRLARTPRWALWAGKIATAAAVAAAAVGCLIGCGLVVGVSVAITQGLPLPGLLANEDSPLVSHSPLWVQICVAWLIVFSFAMISIALVSATHSTAMTVIAALLLSLLLPLLSPWDVRAASATVALKVFNFWGQFRVMPKVWMGLAAAAAELVLYMLVCMGITWVAFRRRSSMASSHR